VLGLLPSLASCQAGTAAGIFSRATAAGGRAAAASPLPPPPPPGLGPPPSRSPLAPLRAPGRSGLLGLEVGRRHAASGTPTSPRGGRCCRLLLSLWLAQDPGHRDREEQPRFQSAADKRAHHNALERKRRDHIKDSFHSLRDSVPSLQGEKASRAQILDKATEYIQYMRRKNHTHQQDIDDLKRQNALLEQQVRALEKARSSAQLQTNYPSSDNSLYTNAKGSTISAFDGGSDSSSESEPEEPQSRKKLRMEAS
uniref:Protein max n=2 Tax=Sus scrofa TaxID=9823 RepID=A0A8D0QM41_PIG